MDNLNELVKSYDNSFKLSNSQINLIRSMFDQIFDDNKCIFKKDIEILDKLKYIEVNILIETMKKYIPASIPHVIMLYNKFGTDGLNKLLNKDTHLEMLTQHDAEILTKGPKKFKAWFREHPIRCEPYWEYGWQESKLCKDGRLVYLKFYDMMMLDYDNIDYDGLITHLKKFPKFRFRIYKTYNGFHVFIISKKIFYGSPDSEILAKELLSDIYYTIFCNKTGYKIRLSKKMGRNEQFLAKFITEIGDISYDPICYDLIKVHDFFISHFDKM